ncbi:sigma-S stabilization anti-adapter protein IraP [Enterobacter sp.]|uniref:sigma-S stabilization anti-adapter protein IraP n=1 Tax=Enterobacter sp. TaxID=42895 RepID=UPI00296E88EE|nr:sigma-S stabilization anti-adapter protein IraP [Enterobacter sp.]
MKHLIADLIEKIADQETSKKDALFQLDALQIVITALFANQDSLTKEAIRNHISYAFERLAEEGETAPVELERLKGATFALLNREIVLSIAPAGSI